MRRYAKSLTVIGVLVLLAGLVLGFQNIDIGGFERGGDTPLGLNLGLDLQGGSHLEYQATSEDPVTGEPVPPSTAQMESLRRTIEDRVNKSGLGEPIIQLLGDDRLLIQLPGVDDPARAKSIIGETAQLEFKHRSFNVSRAIEGLAEEDILSVTIGPRPTLTVATTTVATTTAAGIEPAAPAAGDEEPAGEPEAEIAADVEGTVDEPAAEPTEESMSPQAEGEPSVEHGAEQAEGMAPDESGGEAAAQETIGEEGAQEDELRSLPFLIVEFTDNGAEVFDGVLLRLIESSLPGISNGQLAPNSLSIGLEGLQSATFQERFVERVGDSNTFAILLSTVGDVGTGRETYGDGLTVKFVEILARSDEDIGLTGDDLLRAYASQHPTLGEPIVNIEFKSEGTRKFGELTAQIVGTSDVIAIFLDDAELIAPSVRQAITGGTAFIQGGFTFERASDVALLLEAGRLPLPIELIKEQSVDAILGADSLRKSVVAGLIGLGLILLFMVLYYRAPGVIAAAALIIYTSLLLAIFKILPVTLTLSGVAAVILSIGMAVDANILIFERMKEELRAGRTLLSSINIGFNRAWPAIRDGNVSTLITTAILFWFSDTLGATVVKGFAVTLAIGVATSMFSAIIVSRTALRLLATTGAGRHLGLFVPAGGADLPQQGLAAAASARS